MTLLLGGVSFIMVSLCVLAVAIILGQNAIYNGMQYATISIVTFIVSYLGVRHFLREMDKCFKYLKDEAYMAGTIYAGLFLAGMLTIWIFGDKNPSETLKEFTFFGATFASIVVAVFIAYFWEVEEEPK